MEKFGRFQPEVKGIFLANSLSGRVHWSHYVVCLRPIVRSDYCLHNAAYIIPMNIIDGYTAIGEPFFTSHITRRHPIVTHQPAATENGGLNSRCQVLQ